MKVFSISDRSHHTVQYWCQKGKTHSDYNDDDKHDVDNDDDKDDVDNDDDKDDVNDNFDDNFSGDSAGCAAPDAGAALRRVREAAQWSGQHHDDNEDENNNDDNNDYNDDDNYRLASPRVSYPASAGQG